MRQDSVYIEQNDLTQQKNLLLIATDKTNGHPEQPITTNNLEQRNKCANSRNRCREEKHYRRLAEQNICLRGRFQHFPSDQLVPSCSADLLNTIFLHGRMYITTHHLLFYTNLFGKITKDVFLFISLAKVEKRRCGLIQNAIKFYFKDQDVSPVVITSLNHLEKVFSLI